MHILAPPVAVTLGLLFYSVDVLDALSEKRGLERAVEVIDGRDPQPTIWHMGCCGFQFYAVRHGMRPLIPYLSMIRSGDWLVIPDRDLPYARTCVPATAERVDEIHITDRVPLVMMSGYYVGRMPMRRLDGPRRSVALDCATTDFVACAAPVEYAAPPTG